MLKFIFPSMLSIYFNKKINFFMLMIPFILFYTMIKNSNNKFSFSTLFFMDNLSWMMILLTLMSVLLIILSSYSPKNIYLLITLIMIILFITFSMSNMFNFYIMFEMVLIPTMILITKLGKQPERLQAGMYLILYTVLASLPLLISILFMKNNMSFIFASLSMLKFKLSILLIMAFLVKMPMFFTHLWLPKAHVEAPLEGSMILAAVLLKLGGFGLIRIIPMCMFNIFYISPWIISISLMGASFTGLNCIRQKDMKSLIAYSSVAHMGLTLASILSLNNMGLMGAIMMMIAHGMSSSALFFLVNDLYMKIHSRNIILFKGLISIMPNMTFWWFIFMAVNISAPPTINTISEIFIISSLISWSLLMIIPVIMASFTTASFSLSLFVNISHNKIEMNKFIMSKQKSFLSLFIHLIPLIMLLMKMNMMFI